MSAGARRPSQCGGAQPGWLWLVPDRGVQPGSGGSTHRCWYAVLIAVGMLMVYARKFMTHVRGDSILFTRWLPLTSAAVMTILGLAIAARSLITGGILQTKI